jgi:hypothetical protein
MASFWEATVQPIRDAHTFKRLQSSTSYGKGAAVEEEIIDNAIQEASVQSIKIEPKSVYSFNLVFKPVATGYYEFLLPIFLEGFIRSDSLTKVISCLVVEPRFIVEPAVVRFKTKIINDKDSGCFHPFVEYLTLRNPTDRILCWKLDMGCARKGGASVTSYSSMSLFNRSLAGK